MNNYLKKIVVAVLAASLMIVPAIPANAMTKKQVNSQITKLQTQIKKDKSSYNSALKKDQDLRNTYTWINGTLYSTDEPYIVKVYNKETQTDIYYHFVSLENLDITQQNSGSAHYVTGYAKVSNKTFDFYGTKAIEAVAKEDPHSAQDKQTAIKKNQSRIKSFKNSKKESITLDPSYTIITGQSLTITPVFKYNTSDINKITWKSSNTKIVKISKNGNLLGIAPGTTTVSAKLSVTGKTYKTTVNVIAQ